MQVDTQYRYPCSIASLPQSQSLSRDLEFGELAHTLRDGDHGDHPCDGSSRREWGSRPRFCQCACQHGREHEEQTGHQGRESWYRYLRTVTSNLILALRGYDFARLGVWQIVHTTRGTDLDVEGSDAKLLATSSNILSSQHSSVGRRLVTVSLDLHTTSDTANGFATTTSNDQLLSTYPKL